MLKADSPFQHYFQQLTYVNSTFTIEAFPVIFILHGKTEIKEAKVYTKFTLVDCTSV